MSIKKANNFCVCVVENWWQRTDLLLGEDGRLRLEGSRVLVVGVGGVGAYALEMLVRSGVGCVDIIDGDVVGVTNLNRQLPALNSTLGKPKVDVLKERMLDINPNLKIDAVCGFVTVDNVAEIVGIGKYDFVIDAIDSVSPKVALIAHCLTNKINIISSMGAGGRMDLQKIQYADIWETHSDGLAKAVRDRLKKLGIRKKLKVVWSSEQPSKSALTLTNEIACKVSSYGTVSFLPAVFGCYLAAFVIRKISER